MKNHIFVVLACAAIGIAPLGAAAQDASGLYVSAAGAYNLAGEDIVPFGQNIAVDADFPRPYGGGNGRGLGLGIGYVVNAHVRLEARVAHRSSDTDDTQVGTGSRSGFDYNVQFEPDIFTAGADAYVDLPVSGPLVPFIKAGVGLVRVEAEASIDSDTDPLFTDVLGPAGFLNEAGRYPYAENSDTGLAWNLGAGASYRLSPRWALTGEYQYLVVGDVASATDDFTDSFGANGYAIHEFSVGLRLLF